MRHSSGTSLRAFTAAIFCGELGEPGAQVARLAFQLAAQRRILRLLVALEQIAQALVGVGQLLAERGQILEPLPSDQIVQQQHVVLQLGDVFAAPARPGAPRPPAGGLPFSAASAFASSRSRCSRRSAMPASAARSALPSVALAAVLVDQLAEQRQVRLLGVVHAQGRSRRLRASPPGTGRATAPVLEPLRQIADELLEQLALPLQPILQALVRVLDDHVQRARRADLRARRHVVAIARLDPVGDPLGAAPGPPSPGSHSVRPCTVRAPLPSRSSTRCSGRSPTRKTSSTAPRP